MTTTDLAVLVDGYDPFDEETARHKWQILAHAREHCPVPHVVPRTDPSGDYRMITRYADVRYVLEHPEIFSSANAAVSDITVRLPPLDADPPLQQDFRRILNPLMSRGALLRFEAQMRAIANDTIDEWIDAGRVEFVHRFAIPFSAGVLSRVIFDEDDRERVDEAVAVVSRCALDPAPESFFQLAMVAANYIEKRAASPSSDADDILTAIAAGRVCGRAMTEEESLGVVTVLFLAGLDTTRGALGNIAAQVALNPALETRLRNPKWIRRHLDEFLRFESPVAIMARTVLEPVELSGHRFSPGDRILNFGSANRDSAQFPDGDRFDFDLERPGNMAFGLSIHRCLGSNLARLQLEIGWDELLKRITNLRPVDGFELHYETGMVHGPAKLELTFDRV